MTQDPIRVYVLAKELGVDSEVLVREAQRLGLKISSALSAVSREQYLLIVDALRRHPPEENPSEHLPPDQPPPDDPPLGIYSKLLPRGPRPGAAQQQLLSPDDQLGRLRF